MTTNWEENFSKKFVEYGDDYLPHLVRYKVNDGSEVDDIKAFISSTIKQREEEIVRGIIGLTNFKYEGDYVTREKIESYAKEQGITLK